MFPVYKGTYERMTHPTKSGSNEERDETIQGSKDLRRSLDYLETRTDIDHDRPAFYGFSWGGIEGPVSLALESRFKTAVLADGGCEVWKTLPEEDPLNFVSHIKDSGTHDQWPLRFWNSSRNLPTALLPSSWDSSCRQASSPVRIRTGIPLTPWFKETLDWLDHYLGRVK